MVVSFQLIQAHLLIGSQFGIAHGGRKGPFGKAFDHRTQIGFPAGNRDGWRVA